MMSPNPQKANVKSSNTKFLRSCTICASVVCWRKFCVYIKETTLTILSIIILSSFFFFFLLLLLLLLL